MSLSRSPGAAAGQPQCGQAPGALWQWACPPPQQQQQHAQMPWAVAVPVAVPWAVPWARGANPPPLSHAPNALHVRREELDELVLARVTEMQDVQVPGLGADPDPNPAGRELQEAAASEDVSSRQKGAMLAADAAAVPAGVPAGEAVCVAPVGLRAAAAAAAAVRAAVPVEPAAGEPRP